MEIAINHEEQHIELLLTEIKRIKGENPVLLRRPYAVSTEAYDSEYPGKLEFIPFPGGDSLFGNVEGGWCWDNELGIHRSQIRDFRS